MLKDSKNSFTCCLHLEDLGPQKIHIRKPPSSDLEVFNQVFIDKEYKALVDYVLSYQPADEIKTIIDAGANVGYTTLYLKRHFKNATILSVEPERRNFRQLTRNIKTNKLQLVKALQAGLWKGEEKLDVMGEFRDNKEWSFQLGSTSASGTIQGYSVKRLMEMQGWHHIDILKMDIEGAERYLFETNESVSTFLPNVKFIALEIHDEYPVREKIYTSLRENHFVFFDALELTIGVNTKLLNSIN